MFAQSKGLRFDTDKTLKETVAQLGGRGGGTKDMAQGGGVKLEGLDAALTSAAAKFTLSLFAGITAKETRGTTEACALKCNLIL